MDSAKLAVLTVVSLVPLIGGTMIGIFGNGGKDSQEWYQGLQRPVYTPPPLVFSIVWPILYVLIGGAVFVASFGQEWKTMLILFAVLALNLLFNFSFTFFMFRFRDLLMASLTTWMTLATSLLLLVAVINLPDLSKYPPRHRGWMEFAPVWFLAPYVAWLVLASVLSSDIFLKNPLNRKKVE